MPKVAMSGPRMPSGSLDSGDPGASNSSRKREGWGKTKRWSKRAHYFDEGRSLCSGSAPADGPLASVAVTVDGEVCPDCLTRLRARENRLRGSNRPAHIPARLPRLIGELERPFLSA